MHYSSMVLLIFDLTLISNLTGVEPWLASSNSWNAKSKLTYWPQGWPLVHHRHGNQWHVSKGFPSHLDLKVLWIFHMNYDMKCLGPTHCQPVQQQSSILIKCHVVKLSWCNEPLIAILGERHKVSLPLMPFKIFRVSERYQMQIVAHFAYIQSQIHHKMSNFLEWLFSCFSRPFKLFSALISILVFWIYHWIWQGIILVSTSEICFIFPIFFL